MDIEQLWRCYAKTWSDPPAERATGLATVVDDHVSYTDPHGPVDGVDCLSDYMAAFQQNVPGAHFRIRTVLAHHSRSLARWDLLGSDGSVLQAGTSVGTHADDGRLQTITGFFEPSEVAR